MIHRPRAWTGASMCKERREEGSAAGPVLAFFMCKAHRPLPPSITSQAMLIKCRIVGLASAAVISPSATMVYFWDLRGNHKQLILLAGNASTTSNLFGGMLCQCRQTGLPSVPMEFRTRGREPVCHQ